MKALVLYGPQKLIFESDWQAPQIPAGWTMVAVQASGVCGSDLPRIMQTGAYHHPMIPGHEFSGEVIFSPVLNVRQGQKVAVLPIIPCGTCDGCNIGPFHCRKYDFIGSRRDGGYAELCAVPPDNLFPLPENISAEEGAFIEPLSVTLHVLRRSGMEAGARVLVFGGGAIGILIAQWAKILGAGEVFLADIREASLAIANNCGIDHVVNPLSDSFKFIGEFDYIFEAAGANAALHASIDHASPHATITIVGREINDTVIPLTSFECLMRKELHLKGCWGYDLRQEREFLYRSLQNGELIIRPMITHRIALQDGAEIIEKMWEKSFFYCKVMFISS